MKRLFIAFGLLLTLLPELASAQVTHFGLNYPLVGRGVRPLGMGNAFLTMKGTDQNTIFYNPAAIADYSNEVTLFTEIPPGFEFNYGTINLIRDVFNFKDDLDKQTTDSGKTDVFRNFVNSHMGEFHDIGIHFPIIGAYNRYFYATLINDDQFAISFRNRAFPNFEIRSYNVAGVQVGSAYKFLEDTLSVGAAVKGLYGVANDAIVTTNDILINNFDDFKWNNWKRGLGVGFDLGVKYDIPDFGMDWLDTIRPSVAVTYQNIGNTKFRWMKKNGGPDDLPQSVSAGMGIYPTLGAVKTALLVDIREINVREDFLLKLNAGAEAIFPSVFLFKPSLRAGVNQGYPTVGGGLEIGFFTWNLAFFGKEMGQYTREKAGYRLASEFVWSF